MDVSKDQHNFSDYNCTTGPKVFMVPHITEEECQLINDVIVQVFSDLIYALSFIAVVVNVIKVIRTVRGAWTTTQIYLLNLAVAHTIFLLACPVWGMYLRQHYDWHLGKYACSVMNFTNVLGHCGGILFVCVICIDRMVTIYFPTLSLQYKNLAFAKMIVMTAWALSIVMATLSYVYTPFTVYGGSKHFCGSMQVSNILHLKSVRALILFVVPNVLVPTFFMVPCYTKIVIYFLCQKPRLPFDMGRAVRLDVVYLSSFIVLSLSTGYILMIICFVYLTSLTCHRECAWANLINVSNETARLMNICNTIISPLVYLPKCWLSPCTNPCNCPKLRPRSHTFTQPSPDGVSSVQLVYISCVTEDTKVH